MQKRPLGVSILAVILIITSTAILIMQLLISGKIGIALRSVGFSEIYVMFSIIFLAMLGLFSGIGMWLGKKWGWWLGAFYLFYAIARYINAIILIPTMVEHFGAANQQAMPHYIKFGGRTFFSILILLYFFKDNVVTYFKIDNIPAWKRVLILSGSTILLVALINIIGAFFNVNPIPE